MISVAGALEPMSIVELFLMLAMGHCVADYPLQTDRIAIEKCRGCSATLSWQWWLAAHAGTHAFFVAWITAQPLLGLAEWIAHALIDHLKCQKLYNLAVDQFLHLMCKLVWAILAIKCMS